MLAREQLSLSGIFILRDLGGLTTSTIFYGMSIPLFALAVSSFLRPRRAKSHIVRIMIWSTFISFLLASLDWAANLSRTCLFLRAGGISFTLDFRISQILIWIPLLLQLISDAIIIWRAWVLFTRTQRWPIACPILFFLGAFALGFAFGVSTLRKSNLLTYATGGSGTTITLVYASLSLSAATNIISTALIGYRLWAVRNGELRHLWSQGETVLLVIIESGALYAVLQLVNIALFPTRNVIGSPTYYASNAISAAYVPLTAMYPSIVLVLIDQKRSMIDMECFSAEVTDPVQNSTEVPHTTDKTSYFVSTL